MYQFMTKIKSTNCPLIVIFCLLTIFILCKWTGKMETNFGRIFHFFLLKTPPKNVS